MLLIKKLASHDPPTKRSNVFGNKRKNLRAVHVSYIIQRYVQEIMIENHFNIFVKVLIKNVNLLIMHF